MNRQPQWYWKRFMATCVAGAMILAAGTVPIADAQTPSAPANPSTAQLAAAARKIMDGGKETQEPALPETLPAPAEHAPGVVSGTLGCATCGGCADGHCIPGRFDECCGCNSDTFLGRILCGFYQELCCPDQCYDPKWIPVANAAFFVEGTRPVTTTRIRWEYANDFTRPDRSEFFWASKLKGPKKAETSLNYSELSLYQEVAAKGFSGFIEMPYLSVDPQNNPFAAGFGDLRIGTKSLLFDRDLFQLGFMFTTYVPSGNFLVGLGTGHVSLEPSLLSTVKITPDTYLQTQLSEWIPIGGDADDQGSILHYHFSLNHVLFRPLHNIELIGTGELSGYSFQAGRINDDPLTPSHPGTYVTMGPGIRLVICEWLDFGFGTAFALGSHGPDQVYRTELRIRF